MQEQKAVANKLKLLVQNPFYPSLRTKKVQGLDNVFEMSFNMDIRILWEYENGIIIILPDVGHRKNILGVQYFKKARFGNCQEKVWKFPHN